MLSFLLSISNDIEHSKIEKLYYSYHDDMVRFAKNKLRRYNSGNCERDAEDAVQNAFVKIIKHINKIDFSNSEKAIKAYVFTIISNEVSNIISDIKYCDDIDEYTDALGDEGFIEKINIKESYDIVVHEIKKMDERYSTTLLYYFCYDMTVQEIAKMLGISEKTIYTRLERGKAILLKNVKEVLYE